jgi:hypothetical protein
MASETAKKVAGTFVADNFSTAASVLNWATRECRRGVLAPHIKRFCDAQQEIVDPSLLYVEAVSSDCIQCCIPCRLADHESSRTFLAEIRFRLNPFTGDAVRLTEGF